MVSQTFHRVFDSIWSDLLTQAAEVEANLQTTVNAFVDRRPDLAADVRRRERAIDAGEILLEEECLRALALYQPVASDLRRIATVLKVNGELERMSDLARHIAKRVKKLREFNIPADLAEWIEDLARSSLVQVRDSLDALARKDAAKARAVVVSDRFVDRKRREIINRVKDEIRKAPDRIDDWLRLINTTRNLERISDHAGNIAEMVVYLNEGRIVRHGKIGAAGTPPPANPEADPDDETVSRFD